jgi:signal transduction histidine kinase
VSNNIAHDLRTPLTRLRSQIEELKAQPASAQDIEGLLAEADHILAMFQSLLRIANLEKASRSRPLEKVELAPLLRDVADLYEPVAEERRIRLSLKVMEGYEVRGDRHLLFQLFANLLDNAVKFSAEGEEVRVGLSDIDGKVCVTIEDHGPGIPDAEKPHVFTRLYRGDASRHTPGHGLGLSLAQAIAKLHQAEISLEDARPGLKVFVTF